MQYDFDTIIERRGTGAVKYDFAARQGKPEDALPLWVADMDFALPPEVTTVLEQRCRHGVFGYSEADEGYYAAVYDWYARRFNWETRPEWLVRTPGVVFALAVAIRAFTQPDEAVMIQPPVYYPFSSMVTLNQRQLVLNPLRYEQGAYSMDLAALERQLAEQSVKLLLLCSPHNPVGRVWTEAELKALGDICRRHGVIVVSDEIHSDFVWSPHPHTVWAQLGEAYAANAVICTAPSKTFNLAGLQCSNIFIPDRELRRRFKQELARTGYSSLNSMALLSCEAVYRQGEDWLEQLKLYLQANTALLRSTLAAQLPEVRLVEPQGSYLRWLDCSRLGLSAAEREQRLLRAGLWLDSGAMFGAGGEDFERLNIACPRPVLQEALQRLQQALGQ